VDDKRVGARTVTRVTADATTASRLAAQLLVGPKPSSPEAVTGHLLAVQAQDPRGARLSIRPRSDGLTAADVDRALTDDRSLVITWLNRGTLHLVRSEDLAWLHALTAPTTFTANARRLVQEGVTADAAELGVTVIERSLTDDGPLTRADLKERLDSAGVPTQGQALVHLLLLASLRGVAVRGPMVGQHQAFVLVRDWLGAPPAVDREVALAELARRYLVGHGPATDRDLAKWAGLGLGDARAALRAIGAELDEGPDGLVDLAGRSAASGTPPPTLLGPFDPLLLGWVSREPIVGSHLTIVTTNGLFRPFALVDGRAVATWSLAGGVVELKPFGRLSAAVRAALDREAVEVLRFVGNGGSPAPEGGSV
jgi:hypothetical protein